MGWWTGGLVDRWAGGLIDPHFTPARLMAPEGPADLLIYSFIYLLIYFFNYFIYLIIHLLTYLFYLFISLFI